MKKIIIIVLVLAWATGKSQIVDQAKALLDKKSGSYDPKKAFTILTTLAQKGDAEAINIVGTLLSKGEGIEINEPLAIKWFENAASRGFGPAWYNLGEVYKYGIGTDLNFEKAYSAYKQGTTLNSGLCYYGLGYMQYKGLGCSQSYKSAVAMFKKGSALNDHAAMYMLGLCFRNGYGIAANADSAKYWLVKSSDGKYPLAALELASPQPENPTVSSDLTTLPLGQNNAIDLRGGFIKIPHDISTSDLTGDYFGYAIKFDWSGQHMISTTSLKVQFKNSGKQLNGRWTEDDVVTVPISANLSDTAIIFKNMSYSRTDHYHQNSPDELLFKDAKLHLVKNADTVLITGNLQLFSTKSREPERPTFIMLLRIDAHINENSFAGDSTSTTSKTDSVHFIAFPNPFTTVLQYSYTLKSACSVRLVVSRLTDATIVFRSDTQQLGIGDHTGSITLNSGPGTYVFTLSYGNKFKSAIVFKQ